MTAFSDSLDAFTAVTNGFYEMTAAIDAMPEDDPRVPGLRAEINATIERAAGGLRVMTLAYEIGRANLQQLGAIPASACSVEVH